MQSIKKLPKFCKQGILLLTRLLWDRNSITTRTRTVTIKTIIAAISPEHEVDFPSSAAETNVEQLDFTGSHVVFITASVVVNVSVVVTICSSLIEHPLSETNGHMLR